MKKILFIVFLLSFLACEDVIEVDLPNESPRLVVDALVRVDTNEPFTDVVIKVSQTSSFFENNPPANLDQITMINVDNPPSGNEGILFEQEPGIYSRTFPTDQLITDNYVLQINFNNEIFIAESRFVPSAELNSITQGDGTLFSDDDVEIIINYTDNVDRTDFYLFDFDFNNFLTSEDTFYQNQEFEFSYFYDENMVQDETAEISIMGIDEEFYNYMNLLLDQSDEFDSPFQTPSVTVRGNIINATEIDNINNSNNVNMNNNFALGYFAIVEEIKETITIQ